MRSCVEVTPDRSASLRRLREAIETVSNGRRVGTNAIATGWREVDAVLPGGGLAPGALHEWFGLIRAEQEDARRWSPPLSVLVHLAARAAGRAGTGASPITLWIGQRVWPYGYALWRTSRGLFASSVFVATRTTDERHWAIDVALRSAGAGGGTVIVADAAGMPLAMSRRLQLAAEAGGSLGLLARPQRDEAELSVAVTRWRVSTVLSDARSRRWSLELVRSKGTGGGMGEGLAHGSSARAWTLEDEDGSLVVVPPAVADRSGASALAS
ncbi:MAG: hypothetical protein KF768_14090 [Phycisphaeraceae bacterium]|nr:hypothetical protein [Phycisphaeraceae bacterium]